MKTLTAAENKRNSRIAFRHYGLLVSFYAGLLLLQISAFRSEIAERVGLSALACVVGIFIWSFVEYLMHRYSFHGKLKSGLWNYLTTGIHRDHHGEPWEPSILVTPFRVNFPVYVALTGLFYFATGKSFGLATMTGLGLLIGFLSFETIHILIHHTQVDQKLAIMRWFKRYHLHHHHADSREAFGVTSRLWDHVFGTFPKRLT